MLLVGDYITILKAAERLSIKNKIYMINLSSANMKVQPSTLFYVPQANMETNMYDIEYGNFIFNNTQQRIELLYLLHELQIGNNVLIMIGDYPGMYEMAESLLKLIQTRYGYRGYFITMDDIDDLLLYESNFSVTGLLLFDQEKVELDELFLKQEEELNRRF